MVMLNNQMVSFFAVHPMSGASPEAGSLGDSERGELGNWKGMLGDLWVLLIVVQGVQTLER